MAGELALSEAQARRLIKMYNQAEREILTNINKLLLIDPASRDVAYQQGILARVQRIRDDLWMAQEHGARKRSRPAIWMASSTLTLKWA